MKKYIVIIGLFISISLILLIVPNMNGEYIKQGKLYISEVMPKNSYTVKDDYSMYSDYIEIYNGYNRSINLKGYHLSDSEYDTDKWTFPDVVIKPKSYLLVYATNLDKCENNVCHTNFKLSSKGEVLTLSDSSNNIISKIKYPNLSNDVSYGYANGKYMVFNTPTPGAKNENKSLYTVNIKGMDISINEYMTKNKGIVYNGEGYACDFVELYNKSTKNLNLEGLYLTDDITKLRKHKIKGDTIEKEGFYVVYLNCGTSEKTFGITTNEELILSNGKDIIDRITLVELKENISYGKVDNTWKYFTRPTPGYENNTAAFEKIGN